MRPDAEAREASEPRGELTTARGAFGAFLLADPELRHRLVREVNALAARLGEADRSDGLMSTLEQREEQTMLVLHRSAPFTPRVRLRARARRLASLTGIDAARDTWFAPSLARGEPALPRIVAAYARSDDQGAYLDLYNLLPVPVSVVTLRHDDGGGSEATPVTLASRVSFPITLEPTPVGSPARPARVRYRQPNAAAVPEQIRGLARIAGDRREHEFVAVATPAPLRSHPVPTATLDEVLTQHPFLRREPGELALHTQPGRFHVEGSLVMPRAMALVIEPGTELVFDARGALIASGPLDIRGTAEEPVILFGNAERRGARWQGVALLEAAGRSRWSHVEIRNATGVERPGWKLPAGVTVRNAAVEMEAVRITGSRADAGLAAIDTDIEASGLTIERSAGTAVLVRGGHAHVDDLTVAGAGRHGLAANGARVELSGGSLREIHATALEAADGSELRVAGLEIAGASIAAAAKNGSRLTIERTYIQQIAHVPFLAFTDRLELGGGEIRATGNRIEGSERIAIAQRGSRAVIDGVPTPPVNAAIGGLRID
jgi:hypothetical protein